MITLYEILEVSEKASNEVIDKAYKILAKRYHPDLQQPGNRKQAEEKMKQINDAYDTLSNVHKREEYDAGLKRMRERQELEKARKYESQNLNRTTRSSKFV